MTQRFPLLLCLNVTTFFSPHKDLFDFLLKKELASGWETEEEDYVCLTYDLVMPGTRREAVGEKVLLLFAEVS